jgi:hypothetical protein
MANQEASLCRVDIVSYADEWRLLEEDSVCLVETW